MLRRRIRKSRGRLCKSRLRPNRLLPECRARAPCVWYPCCDPLYHDNSSACPPTAWVGTRTNCRGREECSRGTRRKARVPTHAVGGHPEQRQYPRAKLQLPVRLRAVGGEPEP